MVPASSEGALAASQRRSVCTNTRRGSLGGREGFFGNSIRRCHGAESVSFRWVFTAGAWSDQCASPALTRLLQWTRHRRRSCISSPCGGAPLTSVVRCLRMFMISWRDKEVRVQARLLPRFLWTTASIDVFLGERCILRTGGQLKLKGSHGASFSNGDSEHQAELSWGYARQHAFPYRLSIDGTPVSESQVFVRNWSMGFIPVIIIGALLFLFFGIL